MAKVRELLEPLFVPLAYLRIRHPIKRHYDLTLPLVASGAVLGAAGLGSGVAAMCGDGGIFSAFTDLIQIFAGFYITALAAIASFPRPELDELMEKPSPELPVRGDAGTEYLPLSRRRFLCFLFGYLAFSSLVLYFAGRAGEVLLPVCAAGVTSTAGYVISAAGALLYVLWGSHMVVTTLLGIWYLTDRIHRGNVRFTGVVPGNDRSQDSKQDKQG